MNAVTAASIVSQYSRVYTQLCEETHRRDETNNCGLQISTYRFLAGGIALCGHGTGTGVFYHQEISIFDTQPSVCLLWLISCPHFLARILKFESCK